MNEPIEVLITIPFNEEQLSQLRGVSPRLRITTIKARKVEEVPNDVWGRAEILYTNTVLPSKEQAPHLEWVQFHWAGVDHALDHPLLQEQGLVFTTLSGASASQIAEYALMMMLALGHRLPEMQAHQARAEWPRDRWERFSPVELRGATVGIVGYGSIGRQIARLLHIFGATVLATKHNPMRPEDHDYIPEGQGDATGDLAHRIYPVQALRSMLRECDYAVVTVPLTEETRCLISTEELEVLKPTAYLIDISRGGVVDTPALINMLRARKISGAALDVFAEEPLPADSSLWKLPNVLITPHIAGNSPFYDARAVDMFIENLQRYLSGQALYNRFDPERGY